MKMNIPPATRALLSSIAVLGLVQAKLHAQEDMGNYFPDAVSIKPETRKTTSQKLKDLQKSHESAITSLCEILNKLPVEPERLGTKELFAHIDQSDREFKRIRSACTLVMGSLRSDAKAIKNSAYFTDEQKQELADSAQELEKECADLTAKLDTVIRSLASAYSILPRWKAIHHSYRNLQGEDKASEQVKAQVDAYIESFTPGQIEKSSIDSPEQSPSGQQAEQSRSGG